MPRNIVDKIAWWIPIKSIRDNFRNKINGYINREIQNELKRASKTRNSEIVNKYLLGLKGVEIGGSISSDFGIDAINIDRVDIQKSDINNFYFRDQIYSEFHCIKKVDLIADGDNLPFKDNTLDFVFTSHVLEHFYDPIKALKEWYRVVKNGGYIFMIIPHKERTFDKDRERTTLDELINRHNETSKTNKKFEDKHHSVWITEDVLLLCKYLKMNVVEYHDIDDAVGNGFTIVIQK